MAALETYRHSGRIGFLAIPLALGAGLVAAGALAWVYEAALDFEGLYWFSFLATAVYATGIGLAIGFAYRLGKGRNRTVAIVIAVACGIVGDALSFHFAYERSTARIARAVQDVFESVARAHRAELEAALDAVDLPDDQKDVVRTIIEGDGAVEVVKEAIPFGKFLELRADTGKSIARQSKDFRVKGLFLYLVWVIEAVAICVWGAVAQSFVWQLPFCEACNRWTTRRALGSVANVDYTALSNAVREGDLDRVLAPPVKERGSKRAAYTLNGCPTCDQRFLSVALEFEGRDDKGKAEKKIQPVVAFVVVTREQVESLEARLSAG